MRGTSQVRPITPVQFICQNILRMTISDVAKALDVHQTAVTRYTVFPEHHRKTIDRLAFKLHKIRIKEQWHERVPFEDDVPEFDCSALAAAMKKPMKRSGA